MKRRVNQTIRQLRPLSTLPLRLRLRGEGIYNDHRRTPERTERAFALARARTWSEDEPDGSNLVYLEVEIHPYAQLGHQVASWISGYLWAQDLGLQYCGGPLSANTTGLFDFSGYEQLVPKVGRLRPVRARLPITSDERDPRSAVILAGRIAAVRSRNGNDRRQVLLRLALDQPRWDQTAAAPAVRQAVLEGSMGDQLRQREAGPDYIAVHVRRPSFVNDISASNNPNRWVTQDWYVQLLARLRDIPELTELPVRIYSLGDRAQFDELARQPGVSLHLNGDRDEDFTDLCASRLLVAAPSSFSFTAGLASRAAVLMRAPWWHNVPSSGRWAHVGHDAGLEPREVQRALAMSPRPQAAES